MKTARVLLLGDLSVIRKLSLPLLSATALALGLLAGGCGRFDNPGEKAATYLAEGNLPAANIEVAHALEKDANDAEVHLVLARILALQGDSARAQRALAKAKELGADPARLNAGVLVVQGQAQLAEANHADAKASFEGALKALPELPEALLGQAQLAYIDKKPDEAMALIERVLAKAARHGRALWLKARMLDIQGKVDEAASAYDQAATADATQIAPDLAAAEMLVKAGRYDAAQKHIDRARKRAPQAILVQHVQAVLHFHRKDYDKAHEAIQQALRAQPKFVPMLMLAGMTHLARGELQQADQQLRSSVQLQPNDPSLRKLHATALMRMGNTAAALATLAPVLERHPEDADAIMLVAEAHARAKDYAKATAYYEQAAKLRPDRPEALARAAIAQLAGGDAVQGLAALEKASALGGDNVNADTALTMLLLDRGEFQKALAAAQRIQSKAPQNPIGFSLAGVALLRLGDSGAARTNFERAAEIDPGYWPAAAHLAQLDMAAGRRDAAKARIEKVLAKDANSIQSMNALMQITGDRAQFVSSLETARRADPKALAPRFALARAYLAQGLPDRALPIAREALAAAPGSPEATELVGMVQLAAGRPSEALTTFRELAVIAPKSALAQSRIAMALTALGDLRRAESAYRAALTLAPNDTEAKAGLARLHGRENRVEEALKLARELQLEHPKRLLGHALAGDLYFAAKRYSEAAKAYDAGLAREPAGSLVVKRHVAQSRAGQKPDDAVLVQWMKDHPNDIAVRKHLADVRYVAGQYREAIEHYEAIIKADPNLAVVWNNLASAYLRLSDARALPAAEAAFKLQPNDAAILDTLGVAQTRYGKAEMAVDTLKKAFARRPDSAEIQVNYALALAKAGDRAAARAEIRKVVESGRLVVLEGEAKALASEQ